MFWLELLIQKWRAPRDPRAPPPPPHLSQIDIKSPFLPNFIISKSFFILYSNGRQYYELYKIKLGAF